MTTQYRIPGWCLLSSWEGEIVGHNVQAMNGAVGCVIEDYGNALVLLDERGDEWFVPIEYLVSVWG